jgi:hypothetical protein
MPQWTNLPVHQVATAPLADISVYAWLLPDDSPATACVWQGHCLGDPCVTYNDCDGDLICISGKCANGNLLDFDNCAPLHCYQ